MVIRTNILLHLCVSCPGPVIIILAYNSILQWCYEIWHKSEPVGTCLPCVHIISLARSCVSNFFRDWAPFLDKDFSFLQSDREIHWDIMLFNKIYISFINFILIFTWASLDGYFNNIVRSWTTCCIEKTIPNYPFR